MATQARRGRPQKPYITSWDEAVVGLRRERDGRWRITATRETYAESDEHMAVARFRQWEARQEDRTMRFELAGFDSLSDFNRTLANSTSEMTVTVPAMGLPTVTLTAAIHCVDYYATVRRQLIEDVHLLAEMTGLPQLVTWSQNHAPKPSIKLRRLLDVYNADSTSEEKTKNEASSTFTTFMHLTEADTLADLTSDVLKKYRKAMLAKHTPTTAKAYFGRVKTVLAFGKSEGEDATQIDAALSRLAILKAPSDDRVKQPTPISPEHFHALLKASDENWPKWRPRLLVALNFCLHPAEMFSLQWDEIDLKKRTFVTTRSKTGVIRAATLWPETVAALEPLPRRGPFVFTSNRGTKYNPTGQWKTWDKLRTMAECPDVQFDDLRDGSYTAAACDPAVEERFSRLLAGHSSTGLQDSYVQRNPAVVRSACESVHRHYFGE